MKLKSLLLGLLATTLFMFSCGDEEMPTPIDTKNLEASFDVSTVENLVVSFNNTSVDADSYSWSFGDGNTSTETHPTHTYANEGTYTITLTATNSSESKTARKDVTVTEKYAKDGYLVVSVASSSGGATYYAGYYADQPTGNLDLTTKQGFQRFLTKANYKGFIYGRPSDGQPGLSKFGVEKATGNIVTVAQIPLLDTPGDVTIINDELGFLSYFGLKTIQTFNPTTMELTGEINMSGAREYPSENNSNGYNSLVYNEQLGKIYATGYTNDPATPPFYDSEDVWIEVIDVASKTREKTIVHPDAKYILDRGNISSVIDEAGNTYFLCQGSYGIDQQVGPFANVGSRPQIIKVDTNSEFDPTYAYNPINDIGFMNNAFQLMTSMTYGGNNTVYAIGTSQPESEAIQELLAKLATGTITAEEYDQLVFLVLYTENMSVLKIDLNSKSASIVDNTSTAGFAYPYMYQTDNSIITQITKQNGSFNGFYEIDKSSGSASEVCNITAGGVAVHYVNLADGFE